MVFSPFQSFTQSFDPGMKGLSLGSSYEIRTVHNSFARQSVFELDQKVAEKVSCYCTTKLGHWLASNEKAELCFVGLSFMYAKRSFFAFPKDTFDRKCELFGAALKSSVTLITPWKGRAVTSKFVDNYCQL